MWDGCLSNWGALVLLYLPVSLQWLMACNLRICLPVVAGSVDELDTGGPGWSEHDSLWHGALLDVLVRALWSSPQNAHRR